MSRVIDAIFKLTDQFSAPMKNCVSALTDAGREGKNARKQLAAVGDTLTSIGTTLTATVTTTVVAAGAAAVSAASDFESAMASVEALVSTSSDNIEQDMADLEAAALAASTGSLYSASDAAEAMYYMGLAGWSSEEMIAGLDSVLALATAAEMDLSTASDIVTDYLTAFGLTAQDASGFVDQLAYAMSTSNTDVEQLGEAYKNVAATSTQLGYSLEDTTAALMVMANSGIKGGEAGTALSSIMTRLGNNTSGCRDELEALGVTVYDAEGNVQSLSSILDGMKDIWAGLTDEEKSNLAYVVAGKTAQSELMTLLGDSADYFEEYKEGIEDCAGAAEEMGLSTASDIVTDYLAAFGLTAQDATGFADQIAYAVSASSTDVEQLAEAYKNVAAMSTQLGYSLEDTTVALMVMANSGITGGEAGTVLSSIMTRLGNNTSECRDELEALGVTVYDAEGNVQSLSSILEGMQDIWAGLTDEEKSNLAYVVAGEEAQSELMTLFEDSTDSFEEYKEGLEDCTGAAEEMTDIISGTFSSQLEILKGDAENLAITFGELLLPYLTDLVEMATEAVEAVMAMSDEEKEQIIQYAAMAAAVGPVLIVIGKLIKTVSKAFGVIATLSKAGGVLKGVLAAITSPAAVVIAVMAAIAAVAAVLITHIDEVKASISAMIEKNQPQIERLGAAFQTLQDTLSPILSFIVDVFCAGVLGAFSGLIGSVGITYIIETICLAIEAVSDVLQGLVDFITGVFTGNWELAWEGIGEVVYGVIETIEAVIEGLLGVLVTAWDTVSGLVTGIASAVTSAFSGGSNAEDVAGNASGTSSWRGGITRVNESGGEIINLPSGTQIIPHDLARNTSSGTAGNISIAKLADSIIVREDADIDRITDALVRKMQKAQANMGTS